MSDVSSEILARLDRIEAMLAAGHAAPVLLTRRQAAARYACSTRHLDGTLPGDCYTGRGRTKRVIVERADAVMLRRPPDSETRVSDPDGEPEASDEVTRTALRAARRAR
jgi:hypothetical protein